MKILEFFSKLNVLENIPFTTMNPLILLMSAFFETKYNFLSKIVPLLKAIV